MRLWPFFPPPVIDFAKCHNKSPPIPTELFMPKPKLHPIDPTAFFVLPEHYGFPEVCESVEVVYQNRKKLEASENLNEWITKVFTTSEFGACKLFEVERPPRELFMRKDVRRGSIGLVTGGQTRVVFCQVFRRSTLGYVLNSGHIVFGSVTFDEGIAKWKAERDIPLTEIRMPRFFRGRNEIACWHRCGISIFRPGSPVLARDVIFEKLIISERVGQTTGSSLCRLQGDALNPVDFVQLPEKIVCFASSEKFHVTAVGCSDAKLRIRSNETGLKVATACLDDQIPVKILVTPKWGFIVVGTPNYLFVFSVNGILAKKVEFTRDVEKWFTFHSREGFDFIAFVDQSGKLGCFEAMEPDAVTEIDYSGKILEIGFDWRHNCFLIVTQNGELVIIPKK
jgi:hypothetical protein